MRIILSIIGFVSSYFLLVYREKIGDLLGEADWMHKIGGVYSFVVLVGILLFFWSVAYMFNVTSVFFSPLLYLLGVGHGG